MNVQTAVRPEIVTLTDAPANLPTVVDMRAVARETPTAPARGPYPPKIAKSIVKIMREIGTIEKNGLFDANGTKYNYQKWDDLLASLSPLLAENGLIIMQSENSRTLFEGEALVLISYDFTIVNEDGDEWPLHPRWSSVSKVRAKTGYIDDKAVNKCHTAASKYFLINLFKIKSVEVDDSDASEPETPAEPVLSKAKAKPDYTKLQTEIDAITSALDLLEWGKLAAERINVLPPDWRDHLRARYKANLAELRQREASETTKGAAVVAEVTKESAEPEVIWEDPADAPANAPEPITQELGLGAPKAQPARVDAVAHHNQEPPAAGSAKAAMAAMDAKASAIDTTPNAAGIPAFLARKATPAPAAPAFDEAQWLRDLEGAASGCNTADELWTVEKTTKTPAKAIVSKECWKAASALMVAHFTRITAEADE